MESIDEGDVTVFSREGRETERFRPEKSLVTLGLRVETETEEWGPRVKDDSCSWREAGREFVKVRADEYEYVYGIPNPKHTLKYTKVKVPGTQD